MSRAVLLVWGLLQLAGCGAVPGPVRAGERPPASTRPIAVFPVENLSGRPAPTTELRSLLVGELKSRGLGIVDDAVLERAMTRHRVRYTAGLDQEFARALAQETGADGVVILSLELYDDTSPPRVAMFARLVSTGDAPAIRWIDGTAMAGDDSPGLLGIGLVDDPQVLLRRGAEALAASLARQLSDDGSRTGERSGPRKFRPKIVYRSEVLDSARRYSVAVVPFFNKSARKYAGELIALHMMRSLMAAPGLDVVELGVLREELLRFRIIMTDGVSLPETETILNAVNADLVLNGEVLEYQDPRGPYGAPKVDFGLLFIERRTRRVVYSSYSDNAGDDQVFFFDWGRVNTAHALAARMSRAIVERMLPGSATTGTAERATRAPRSPGDARGGEEPK